MSYMHKWHKCICIHYSRANAEVAPCLINQPGQLAAFNPEFSRIYLGINPHLHHPPWSGWKNIDRLPRPLTNQVNIAMAHPPAKKSAGNVRRVRWKRLDGKIGGLRRLKKTDGPWKMVWFCTWFTKSPNHLEWDFCCPEEIYLRICEDLSRPIGLHQTRYITLASDIDTFLPGFRWKSVGIRQVIRLLETFK